MCIFSGPVQNVSSTKIFGRATPAGTQTLVYAMSVLNRRDTAMLLPIPVPPGSPEETVRFIDLHGYAGFFEDMRRGFRTTPLPASRSFAPQSLDLTLKVHEVGDYEASYVPSAADWSRLDPRFRLPGVVFKAVPAYQDYGFAVFKLKASGSAGRGWLRRRGSGPPRPIHPMAFEFPTRFAGQIFFPTVHVHDGAFHPRADFDHELYAQYGRTPEGWETSTGPAHGFMDTHRAGEIIEGAAPCYRLEIRGKADNRDIIVA